ncbi:integration host factor subunit beta [Sphingomonas sp. PsM26]|nr:integration host factor subunit beta [Sphingomonas sp. PsM26]
MIRSELVRAVSADNPDLPLSTIEAAVSCLFEEIENRLVEGGRVELRGLGTFSTRAREERVGRNPRTGEPVQVNAKRALHFRAAGVFSKHLSKGGE